MPWRSGQQRLAATVCCALAAMGCALLLLGVLKGMFGNRADQPRFVAVMDAGSSSTRM